jgi:HEAT repeat protein
MLRARVLNKLINDLSHPDVSRRRSAARSLSEADERAIYPLLKALKDENPGVQDAAMRSLIAIGGEVVVYMVLPLLREDSYLRNTALIILKELGSVSVPFLYPLLKDKDEDVRKFSLDLLGEIKEGVEPEKIVPLLRDSNPNVRAAAADALGELMYKEAVPQLVDALDDEEWVCFSVLEALGKLQAEKAVKRITKLLSSESDALRYAAIETLGKIGSVYAADALLEHISKVEGAERTAAIKSLVQIGVTPSMSDVFGVLMDMLKNGDWEEKLIALKGLVELKERSGVYAIVDIAGSLDQSGLDDEEKLIVIKDALMRLDCADVLIDILDDPSVRYRGKVIVAEVLGDMKCEKAVPSLVRLLEGGLRDVRRASIKALGNIGAEETRDLLLDAVDDYDGHVRRTAAAALGRIGEKRAFNSLLKLLHTERHRDVIEEAVKALLRIDQESFFSHLGKFDSEVKDIIARFTDNADVLIQLSRDKDLGVRVTALSGLGRVHGEKVYQRLKEAVKEKEPEVRRAAVMAMGELNCCHEEIKALLGDDDTWVRLYAVKALGNCYTQDMIKTLVPMLEDRDVPVVLSAIEAIARLGGKEAYSILSSLRNHDDPAVREKVYQVVESL